MVRRFQIASIIFLLSFRQLPAYGTETLEGWAESISVAATQKKVLDRIFPGQVGSLSEARQGHSGPGFFFPKGGMWTRLGRTVSAGKNYLVVSCMMHQSPDRAPMNAVTYVLRDTTSRATALSSGYAASEENHKIILTALQKSFLLILSASPDGSRGHQWGAALYEIPGEGLGPRPRAVWTNPPSAWRFLIGFSAVQNSRQEILVFKATAADGEANFSAYRWDGSRFSEDDFISESVLERLPEDVWRYGSR